MSAFARFAGLFGLVILADLFNATSVFARPHWKAMARDLSDRERVILVHGFARGKTAMWSLAWKLRRAGYAVYRVEYASVTSDLAHIRQDIDGQMERILAKGDTTVHFVGHSMGGLLIRDYLDRHPQEKLGRVVNIGSPAHGTPVVDRHKGKWYFGLAGPNVGSLSARGSEFLKNLKRPDYELGVIAGDSDDRPQDGMDGPDDGLVQVESTRVEGMKDFKVVRANHVALRYNNEVMKATVRFLKNGRFSNLAPGEQSEEKSFERTGWER